MAGGGAGGSACGASFRQDVRATEKITATATHTQRDFEKSSLAHASGSERSWPRAASASKLSDGARSVSEGALPASFVNDPASAGGEDKSNRKKERDRMRLPLSSG